MRKLMADLWRQEEGQALAEYGLILALIAVVAIAGLTLLGDAIKNQLERVGNKVNSTPGGSTS